MESKKRKSEYNIKEIDSDIENKLMVTSGERRSKTGDLEVQTTVYKINKQQGYIVQHKEIQPLFYNNFQWSMIYKNIESLYIHLKLI